VSNLPYKRYGATVSLNSPIGNVHITMNNDEDGNPYEVFIETGQCGTSTKSFAEGLGRVISKFLQLESTVSSLDKVKILVEQLSNIQGGTQVGLGPNSIKSLPDAVAKALEEHYLSSNTSNSGDKVDNIMVESATASSNGDTITVEVEQGNTANVTTSILPNQHKGDICPQCQQPTLFRVEGCDKCFNSDCNYSRCG
jgi:ribonucleoside-diphosphate reductase alpha chain